MTHRPHVKQISDKSFLGHSQITELLTIQKHQCTFMTKLPLGSVSKMFLMLLNNEKDKTGNK
jgi:hypothetical protein